MGAKKATKHCETWDEVRQMKKTVRPSVSAGPCSWLVGASTDVLIPLASQEIFADVKTSVAMDDIGGDKAEAVSG